MKLVVVGLGFAGAAAVGFWKWASMPSEIPKETRNAILGLGAMGILFLVLSRGKK